MEFKKNQIVELYIDDIGNEGEGIGHIDGYALFLKDAVIGDKVRAKIIKTKKNYGFARVEEVIEASKDRVTPRCPKARQCGGCTLQHLAYEKQLEYKFNKVKNCLERIGGLENIEEKMEPILGMEEPFYYRNKAQFPVGYDKEGNLITGFYAGRTHHIIDCTHCMIQHPVNEQILLKVLDYMKKNNITAYDEKTHKGLVRHIVTRVGFKTGEIMVCLVVNGSKKNLRNLEMLVDSLTEVEGMTSICVNINKEKTNRILGSKIEEVYGKPYIYDYIGNVVAILELTQEGKELNISISEAPLLGKDGGNVVASIAVSMVQGLRQYNVIEQYYAYNKLIDKVNDYVYPSSSQITNSWSNIYSANAKLLQLKKADESLLNVYGDYCNVLSALYYSNLIYGWDAVPYITDYSMIEQIMNEGIKRESTSTIFADLKTKLAKAIENLPEKKNESLKDINGFFFASKDVARVLLANIHMYQGNYGEAKSLLQTVVDNGYYTLDASTNFMPSTSTDNISVTESLEVIYAFQYDAGTRASVTIMEPGVMPYITLSDVYLSLAECWYKEGQPNNAEQYISKVLNAKNLTCTETDALMKIKEVREQILLYSGTYFAFLKRTGLAKDICNIADYQLLFPIPSNEMYSNRQMTQNPGY